MVVTHQSVVLSPGEVESPTPMQPADEQAMNNEFVSLGRQSSIYSLTLDEFQHTLSDGGKNFGSMNMDEFLNSIWTAEENQVPNTNTPITTLTATAPMPPAANLSAQFPLVGEMGSSANKYIAKQSSLPRQASFALPPPLCQKTVEEVWSEIHKGQRSQQRSSTNTAPNPRSTQRQATFGEMTLEDFLVKAGVVREAVHPAQHPPYQPHPNGLYHNRSITAVGPTYLARPMMPLGGGGAGLCGGGGISAPTTSALPQSAAGDVAKFFACGKKSSSGYQLPGISYGGGIPDGNGCGAGGGYGQVQGLDSPVSPASSDGIGSSQVDGGTPYALAMGGMRGGKKQRIIDGPVEKVVERRQRRMIKNRESAARSRARKQAYTIELEAELDQLKEENAQLKQALAELEMKGQEQYSEEEKFNSRPKAQKAKESLRMLRGYLSCTY